MPIDHRCGRPHALPNANNHRTRLVRPPHQPRRLTASSPSPCYFSFDDDSEFTFSAALFPRMAPRTIAPNIRATPTSKISGSKSVVHASTPTKTPVTPRMTAAVCIPGRAARFPATQASGDANVARVRSPAQRFGPSEPDAARAAMTHRTTAPTIGSTLNGAAKPIGDSATAKNCARIFTTATLVLPAR
jgi:hypothetical protein